MKRIKGAWTGGLLLIAMAAVPATAKRMESWTAHFPLPVAGLVSVANVQGSIRVEGWDRAEVELTVKKTATGSASLDDVEVAVEPQGDWLHVQTLYQGDSDDSVVVDYCLRVPRQVHLKSLRTVNGDIVVRSVEGPIEAHTLNGNIDERGVAGNVTARTLNGSIYVALRALPEAPGALQLETINGDVQLLFPTGADADLVLNTVAGRIQSDLPFAARAVSGDTSARARLGRGGVPVRLRTVRGDIRLAENDDLL